MKTMRRILAVLLAVMLIAGLAISAAAATVNVQAEDHLVSYWFIHNVVRNNFHSFIGVGIQVGDKDIQVTEIGRMFYAGNAQEHILKIVDVDTKADVASVTVNMAGGTVDQFTYGKLSAPVTLKANKSYYLVSEEHFDGDAFADHGFRTHSSAGASVTGGVYYLPEDDSWHPDNSPSFGFVGLDFKYTMDKTAASGDVLELVGEKQINEVLRNNFDTRIGTAFTVGAKDIYVTELGRIFWNGNSQTHYMAIVDAATGMDVAGTGVTIPTGGTHGEYTWGELTVPVKLSAGKTYYVVSTETNGGDQWLEGGSVLTGTEGITLHGSAFLTQLPYTYAAAADHYFNGTSLKYAYAVENVTETTEEPPVDIEPAPTGDLIILPLALMFISAGAALTLKKKAN